MIDVEEQDIAARRKAIQDDLKVWAPDAMAQAGAIVTVSREGDAEVIRGLVRDADRKAQRRQQPHAAPSTTGASDLNLGVDDRPGGERQPAGFSEALARRLAAHRSMGLQAELCRQPALSLAVLAHVFVQRVFGAEYPRHASALQVTPQTSTFALEAAADDLKFGPAWSAVQAAKEAWRARLPQEQGEWLSWLTALPQTDLVELLALCTALTVNALPSANAGADANAIAAAAGLDMAELWQPSAQAFLNHVPKAQIIQALKEAGPDLAGDELAAMKKDALVSLAESRLAGTRWLPEPLRAAQK